MLIISSVCFSFSFVNAKINFLKSSSAFSSVTKSLPTAKVKYSSLDKIVLDLSSLGFGSNAEVELVLDATENQKSPTNVLSIGLKNIKFDKFELNGKVATRPYDSEPLALINEHINTYDKIDFVPGIFDQIKSITSTKQVGIELDGSVLDGSELGIKFDGWTEFDYGAKNGIASIGINEYKVDKDTPSAREHRIDLFVDNFDGDLERNNVKLEYRDALRGKFTLKTFSDIIEIVSQLLKVPDKRFSKFLTKYVEMFMSSVIGQAIKNTDYLSLTKNTLIKKVGQSNDGKRLELVIGKEVGMGLIDSDIVIALNFGIDANNQKNLSGISIIDLALGEKKINANIKLVSYVNKENPVANPEAENFLDFSDVAVLLQFGIDTVQLDYYHLTASINLKALGFIDINFNLDFEIIVNDVKTCVYGVIPELPFDDDQKTEFVFEPAHDEDNDEIGGYFYIVRSKSSFFSLGRYQTYYKADSDNFLENILKYLLVSMLDISNTLVSMLGNLSLSSSEPKDPSYEDMFVGDGFVYDSNNMEWDLGISLSALTGNNSLGDINGTIKGVEVGDKHYLSQIKASLTLITIVNISATINLIDPNPNISSWSEHSQQRYEKIINYYDKLSDSNKAKALNNPTGGYTINGSDSTI